MRSRKLFSSGGLLMRFPPPLSPPPLFGVLWPFRSHEKKTLTIFQNNLLNPLARPPVHHVLGVFHFKLKAKRTLGTSLVGFLKFHANSDDYLFFLKSSQNFGLTPEYCGKGSKSNESYERENP